MLGRGILQNPFLAEDIKGLDAGDRRQRFMRYYQLWTDELLQAKKERSTLSALKELWHYYSVFVRLPDEELRQLLRINEFERFFDRSCKIIKMNYSD